MANETVTRAAKEDASNSECLFYLDLMSHEVLNFNQAVLGYLEMVKNDPAIGDDVKRYLISAIDQIRNSSQIIDDVKKIVRLGIIDDSSFELLDLKRMIAEGIEELRAQHPQRRLSIRFREVSGSVRVRATEALREVIVNLLANVIRFDRSDEVVMDISVERPESVPGMVDIVVEDRSGSIPDIIRRALTEEIEFYEKTNIARGMGLLLVRAAAKRFGGGLIISDIAPGERSEGARVTIRLPEAIRQ